VVGRLAGRSGAKNARAGATYLSVYCWYRRAISAQWVTIDAARFEGSGSLPPQATTR